MKKSEALGILKSIGGPSYNQFVKPRLLRLLDRFQKEYNSASDDNWHDRKAKLEATREVIETLNSLVFVARKKVTKKESRKFY